MNPLAFVIYSAGRADRLVTTKWLAGEDVFLCVPESQAEDYRKNCPPDIELVIHPDDINRLHKKVAWVWAHFRERGYQGTIKVDDDLQKVRDHGAYYFKSKNVEFGTNLTGPQFIDVFYNLFQMSIDLGIHMFGFGNCNNSVNYKSWERFRFLSAFDGSIYGYRYEDKIKVDMSIVYREEYDLQLQSIYHYGRNLVDMKYRQVQTSMHQNPGGLSSYRNTRVVEESEARFRAKWGSYIKITPKSVSFKL